MRDGERDTQNKTDRERTCDEEGVGRAISTLKKSRERNWMGMDLEGKKVRAQDGFGALATLKC